MGSGDDGLCVPLQGPGSGSASATRAAPLRAQGPPAQHRVGTAPVPSSLLLFPLCQAVSARFGCRKQGEGCVLGVARTRDIVTHNPEERRMLQCMPGLRTLVLPWSQLRGDVPVVAQVKCLK